MPLPQLPGYRIERLAGRGGFGAVYEARRLSDHIRVAIKIADHDDTLALRRLWYEAIALRAIGSPHVPALEDRGVLPDGSRYIVMEWLRAPSLAHRLAEHPRGLPTAEFGPLASAIALALARVHDRGFVHGDVKPEHIIIDEPERRGGRPQIRFLDLGMVKPIHKREPTRAKLRGGLLEGTRAYASPEQLADGTIGVPSDVYSLGLVMFEMAAGRSALEVVTSRVWGARPEEALAEVAWPDAFPPALSRVVERCLAPAPTDRYQTARAVASALTRARGA